MTSAVAASPAAAPLADDAAPAPDAAPAISDPSLDAPSMQDTASSNGTEAAVTARLAELRSGELLALLLAPDLDDSLTPGAIIGSTNTALFHLLPLILAAIHRLGESSAKRDTFVTLISVLRARIAACRGLKLRFLLLIKNAGFAKQWEVKLVHRKDCYTSARHVLDDLARDLKSQNESGRSFKMARSLTQVDRADSKDVEGWVDNTDMVIAFAIKKLLHKTRGIRTRPMKWHMRTVKNAFHGAELVDGIMERANFTYREEARMLAQKLVDLGMVHKMGSRAQKLSDDNRKVYQCRIALQRDDQGHCRLVTDNGVIKEWDKVLCEPFTKVSQIEIQLAMDMIDLQSYEFWTNSVYIKGVEKGHHYGYRAVTHPLHCLGSDIDSHIDTSKALSDDPFLSEDSGLTDGDDLSVSYGGISLEDINHLQEDAAVVGSVIVRKVFASIARPMIVELRIPMENADLDSDDHHTILRPGLLVKEGDNLMQDLGVEIMFQCFNHVWAHSTVYADKESEVPFSVHYEVFPTSPSQGFMEAVTGLQSLKSYNWQQWRDEHGSSKARVNEMLRSTVGAYVGTYVCGGRDRHFDNVLIKDDKHLLHIDFGFLMGTSPPIDGPHIAIAPQMEAVFRDLKVWDKFVRMCVDAFIALRRVAPAIIRTSVIMFSKAGYEEEQIRLYLRGRFSLNVHEREDKAAETLRRQIVNSSGDIKTRFKAFAHEHIDPAWYGLLEKGFPPAVAIMRIVDAKEQKAAKKLSQQTTVEVREDEKIHLR